MTDGRCLGCGDTLAFGTEVLCNDCKVAGWLACGCGPNASGGRYDAPVGAACPQHRQLHAASRSGWERWQRGDPGSGVGT